MFAPLRLRNSARPTVFAPPCLHQCVCATVLAPPCLRHRVRAVAFAPVCSRHRVCTTMFASPCSCLLTYRFRIGQIRISFFIIRSNPVPNWSATLCYLILEFWMGELVGVGRDMTSLVENKKYIYFFKEHQPQEDAWLLQWQIIFILFLYIYFFFLQLQYFRPQGPVTVPGVFTLCTIFGRMPGFEPELLEAFKRKLILIIFANSVYVGQGDPSIYPPPPSVCICTVYYTVHSIHIYSMQYIYCMYIQWNAGLDWR